MFCLILGNLIYIDTFGMCSKILKSFQWKNRTDSQVLVFTSVGNILFFEVFEISSEIVGLIYLV